MDEKIAVSDPQKNDDPFNALLQIEENERLAKTKRAYTKAYMFSIFIPPLGFYYLIKYLFFTQRDPAGIKAGIVCVVLTVLSLIVNIWGLQFLLNQFNPEKSESVNFLESLITPENMKTFRELTQ